MNKKQEENYEKTKEILIGYMIQMIKEKTGGDVEYDQQMSEDAQKHSDHMAKQGKISSTPKELLYSDEIVGSVTIPSNNLKVGLMNLLDKWFKYEANKERAANASKMGIGLSLKEKDNNTKIFATKRMM